MYRELVTVSEYCALDFFPEQEKFFPSTLLRGFTLSWIRAATWVCGQPGLRTSGNLRSYPPVPCLCHRVKQLLTNMDFSFVYLSKSMLSFSLPRRGDLVATVLYRLKFSLTFSHFACPPGTTTPAAIAQSFTTSSSSPKVHIFVQTLVTTTMKPHSN